MSMEKVKNSLGQLSAGKILDFGTGVGEFIELLSESLNEYEQIIGIDTNDKALARAKEHFKNPKISFVNMNAERTEYEDNSFDIVSISNSLHHLSDLKPVLGEMSRVLKPGGIFIINEMYCDNLSEKQLSHLKLHHFFAKIDTILGGCHNETFKKDNIVEIAKGMGINILEIIDYNTDEEQMQQQDLAKEKELIENVIPAMDVRMELIKDHDEYESLKALAEKHKQDFHKNGFFGATQLLIIGRK